MFYRIKETGRVVSDQELVQIYPNVHGINKDTCESFGLDLVYDIVPPPAPRYFNNERAGAEKIKGMWVAKYKHTPEFKTDEDKEKYIEYKKEQDRNHQIYEIKRKRDVLMHGGGFIVGDKWFKSDNFSRAQHNILASLGKNIPANLQWRTLDGSFVEMTPELIKKVILACIVSDSVIFNVAETHMRNVKESDTPWDYDFNGGWPTVFTAK